MVLVASEEAVKKHNLTPLARVIGYSSVGVDPTIMGYGPVPAIQAALKAAGMKTSDLGLAEINEAFAAQYLACEKALGLDRDICNTDGGAIAIPPAARARASWRTSPTRWRAATCATGSAPPAAAEGRASPSCSRSAEQRPCARRCGGRPRRRHTSTEGHAYTGRVYARPLKLEGARAKRGAHHRDGRGTDARGER
jgi:hypothetical protein